jgi:hypothetical protein
MGILSLSLGRTPDQHQSVAYHDLTRVYSTLTLCIYVPVNILLAALWAVLCTDVTVLYWDIVRILWICITVVSSYHPCIFLYEYTFSNSLR